MTAFNSAAVSQMEETVFGSVCKNVRTLYQAWNSYRRWLITGHPCNHCGCSATSCLSVRGMDMENRKEPQRLSEPVCTKGVHDVIEGSVTAESYCVIVYPLARWSFVFCWCEEATRSPACLFPDRMISCYTCIADTTLVRAACTWESTHTQWGHPPTPTHTHCF